MTLETEAVTWDFYLTSLDGQLASIAVDLSLETSAPHADRPHLLWIRVDLKKPDKDGLATPAESEVVAGMEDTFARELALRAGARQVGRLSWLGRREFFYYLEQPEGVVAALDNAGVKESGYAMMYKLQKDPEWTTYLEFLIPEQEERRIMESMRTSVPAPE